MENVLECENRYYRTLLLCYSSIHPLNRTLKASMCTAEIHSHVFLRMAAPK